MFTTQISVFVENRVGGLEEVIGLLAANGIDISALSLADTTDFGILRMIVSDPAKAVQVLKEHGMAVKLTDVLAIAIQDQPGGLAAVLQYLKEDGISIEYMYAFIGKSNGALAVVRTCEPEKAVKTLQKKHVTVLEAQEVYRL